MILRGDSAPLPLSLASHRQLGNYHGAFRSWAELGNLLRSAAGVTQGLSVEQRIALAPDLLERGDIRALEHEDAVHVFGRPGSDADRVLADEGSYLDDDAAEDAANIFTPTIDRARGDRRDALKGQCHGKD